MITIQQDPTFKEIQTAVAKEGIELSHAKFREYVTIGLVKGYRQHGKNRGSRPSTYPKGIEIVRLVHQLNKRPNRIELQDIMYLLYWRGLPINDNKLFLQLSKYQNELINGMNTIAEKRNTDPEAHEYDIRIRIESELRKYHFSPGPPAQSVKAAYEKDVEHHASEIETLHRFMQSLIEHKHIPFEELLTYYNQDLHYTHEITHGTASFLAKYINYESLSDPKQFTNLEHIEETRQLVTLFREYLIDFFKLLDNQLPADNNLRHTLHNLFSDSAFSVYPIITKQVLFALHANGHTSELLHFFEKYKEQWKLIINMISDQTESNIFEKY